MLMPHILINTVALPIKTWTLELYYVAHVCFCTVVHSTVHVTNEL